MQQQQHKEATAWGNAWGFHMAELEGAPSQTKAFLNASPDHVTCCSCAVTHVCPTKQHKLLRNINCRCSDPVVQNLEVQLALRGALQVRDKGHGVQHDDLPGALEAQPSYDISV
jgi:hypothetical protein